MQIWTRCIRPSKQDLRPLHVRIEDTICFGGAKLPLAAVVVSDVAAEHFGLAAKVALSHEDLPMQRQQKTTRSCRRIAESIMPENRSPYQVGTVGIGTDREDRAWSGVNETRLPPVPKPIVNPFAPPSH